MTIVHPPSTDRETNAIEHLDFAPPCGYSLHIEGPAVWAVWLRVHECGMSRPFLLFCEKCWVRRNGGPCVFCKDCGGLIGPPMSNVLRVERI